MNYCSFLKRAWRGYLFINAIMFLCNQLAYSQGVKETIQPLSKQAQKGMILNAQLLTGGNVVVTYGMKVDKKSEQMTYEDYVFDNQINFKGIEPGKLDKESRPDKQVKTLKAYAGGSNSFNVNSQKLNVWAIEGLMTWNYKKQRYELSRKISGDKTKLRNAEGRYDGYVDLTLEEGLFAIASYEPDGKDVKEQFVALYVNQDLDVKETAITTGGNYSLVAFGVTNQGNAFVIMAPKNKMPDLKQYVYAEFTMQAELVTRTTINSPSPNLMVMDYSYVGNDLYLICGSTKSNDSFEEEFTDFASIENPAQGSSRQTQKYDEEIFKTEIDNFHLLRLHQGQLVFSSTTPTKNFEDKVVTPPGQKKAHAYDGKGLYVADMNITQDGEYMIAGQLMDKDFNMKTKQKILKYKDMVALHFDSKGNLKAQYAVEKMNDDMKSELSPSYQYITLTPDKKNVYWEILEVKGSKGYASYLDAYNGVKTYTEHYFPRIAKIDLLASSLSSFTILGEKGKFLVYKQHSRILDATTNTIYYFGHDDDYEKLWVGKYEVR